MVSLQKSQKVGRKNMIMCVAFFVQSLWEGEGKSTNGRTDQLGACSAIVYVHSERVYISIQNDANVYYSFLIHAQAIVLHMEVAQRDLKGKEYRLWQ